MSRPRRLLALASLALPVALPLALACNPSAEEVREDVFEAIAQGDRAAALESLESMRESVGESPDADLEHAGLLVRAGNAPEASWVLEESARQHPDRADIAVALGRVSLLLGNAARAREVVEAIAPETEQHPTALVLRAKAEL